MAQFDRSGDSQVEMIVLRSTAMISKRNYTLLALEMMKHRDGFKGHGHKVTNLWGRGRKKVEPLTELEGTKPSAGKDHKQDPMSLNVWCSWYLQLSNYKTPWLMTLIPIQRLSLSIKAFSMLFLLLEFLNEWDSNVKRNITREVCVTPIWFMNSQQ